MPNASPDPRGVIEQIRREYRVDQADTTRDRYRDIAGGTLPLVTEELYESKTHFFTELLQNADDNDYPADVVPSLTIRAHSDRLELLNNETGFTPPQVDAICNAAKSTKRDRKQSSLTNKGATGEKGIGFKAVFQVSHRPEIHSNGYHFRFDKEKHGPFGVVIPEWIDDHPDDASGTRIILPLRYDYQLPFDFLKSLQPELLLFLRRIRRLEFDNVDFGQSLILEREDKANIVTVVRTVRDDVDSDRCSTNKHTFYVHTRRVDMSDIDEPHRRMITVSDVAVALPLNAKGEVDERLSRRQLFAFLPVKDTALPFLAHADFVVITSREGVRENLAWNVRLRDALAECLADTVIACREVTPPGSTALRVLIDPKEIPDAFLRPIVEGALDRLKQEECVPLLGGGWLRPADALLTDAASLWKLVPPDDVKTLLKRSYVDPTVSGINEPLTRLGVMRFTLNSLLHCLNDSTWRDQLPFDWYPRLYSAFGRVLLTDNHLDAIRKTPILPLARGGVVAPLTKNVFRSLGQTSSYGFENALNILAPAVLKAPNKTAASEIDGFLHRIGVTDATSSAVIDKYILPLHKGDGWQECSDAVLIGHLRYLRDHLAEYVNAKPTEQRSEVARRLGSALWVKTTQEGDQSYYNKTTHLYVGNAYGDPNELQTLLGESIAAQCISPKYLQATTTAISEDHRTRWRELFIELGAKILPVAVQGEAAVDYDWPSEVKECLAAPNSDRKNRLIRLIAEHWMSRYRAYAFKLRSPNTPSSLLNTLRKTSVPVRGGAEACLATCYLASEDNEAVFGTRVPFLSFSVPMEFAESIGIVTSPTVAHAIQRLQALQQKGITDRTVVEPLYKYLDTRFVQHADQIRTALKSEPLLLAEGADGLSWFGADDVCWSMPRELRALLTVGVLSPLWRDSQGFFCERIGLAESLDPEDLVDALSQASNANLDVAQASRIARFIYNRLRTSVNDDVVHNATWLARFREDSLIFTNRGEWWCNDENIFAADDSTLAELFANAPDIAFIDLDIESFTTHGKLLSALEIKPLSEVIDTDLPQSTQAEAWPEFKHLVTERFRLVVRFLHHKHPEVLDHVVDSGAFVSLQTLDAQVCDPLELDVQLNEERVRHRFDVRVLPDDGRATIFVDRVAQSNWDAIGIEIGRMLGLPDTEGIHLGSLIGKSRTDAERLLRTLRIPELPIEVGHRLLGDELLDDLCIEHDEIDAPSPVPEAPVPDSSEVEGTSPAQPTDEESSDDTDQSTVPKTSGRSGLSAPGDNGQAAEPTTPRTEADLKAPVVRDKDSSHANYGVANTVIPSQVSATSPPPPRSRSDDRPEFAPPVSDESDADADADVVEEANNEDYDGVNHSQETSGGPGRHRHRNDHDTGSSANARPPTSPKAPAGGRRPPRRRSSQEERLRSYVSPRQPTAVDDDPRDEFRNTRITEIEAAAIAYVLAYEARSNRDADDANKTQEHNEGYDIHSRDPSTGIVRFIEVKGIDDTWGNAGVMVTPAQFDFALRHGDHAWLYVVENALSTKPTLHRIQNYASRVWRYGFDSDWTVVEEPSANEEECLPSPAAGLRVRLMDGRLGTVVSVRGAGRLIGVNVQLDEGSFQSCRWVKDVLTVVDTEK